MSAVLSINGVPMIDMTRLRAPQDFYDAVDALHTAAIDNMPEGDEAPVVGALEAAIDALGSIEGVRT